MEMNYNRPRMRSFKEVAPDEFMVVLSEILMVEYGLEILPSAELPPHQPMGLERMLRALQLLVALLEGKIKKKNHAMVQQNLDQIFKQLGADNLAEFLGMTQLTLYYLIESSKDTLNVHVFNLVLQNIRLYNRLKVLVLSKGEEFEELIEMYETLEKQYPIATID